MRLRWFCDRSVVKTRLRNVRVSACSIDECRGSLAAASALAFTASQSGLHLYSS